MNLDEIKELLAAVTNTDVTDFELQTGKDKIRIRRGSGQDDGRSQPYVVVAGGAAPLQAGAPAAAAAVPAAQPDTASAATDSPAPEADEDEGLVMVTAPIVGTFYEASAPGAPAFAEIGDKVSKGQVLCIIEAMKLMNEIESEVSGTIREILVDNAEPVEYDQPLFVVEPA